MENIPCVFIATKSDLDLVPQRFECQPDVYCRRLGLPAPVSVSLKNNVTADIYRLLVGVALDPIVAMTGKRLRKRNRLALGMVTALSVAGLGIVIALGVRHYHKLYH